MEQKIEPLYMINSSSFKAKVDENECIISFDKSVNLNKVEAIKKLVMEKQAFTGILSSTRGNVILYG